MNIRRGCPGSTWVLVGVCVGLLGLAAPTQLLYGQTTGIWPKFRHNLSNTGRSPFLGPLYPATTWQFTANPATNIISSAAIGVDGVSYVGTFRGEFYAINPDGTERWRYDIGRNSILSSPAVDDNGYIYFGADNGTLYVLDPSGGLAWSFIADGPIRSSPAVLNGVVYFGTDNGTVYAVDEVDGGTVLWSWSVSESGTSLFSSPALSNGQAIFATAEGILYAYNATSGQLAWYYIMGIPIVSTPAVASDGTVFVGVGRRGGGSGYVIAVNDGSLDWMTEIDAPVRSSPALYGARVYVGADDGVFYALAAGNGAIAGSFQTGAEIFSSPAVDDAGTVYVGSEDGRLYAFENDAQHVWDLDLGAPVTASPAISYDAALPSKNAAGAYTIVVSSFDGIVHAIGEQPQLVIDSVTPTAMPMLDVGEAVTYTVSLVDLDGVPVAGALAEVDDPLAGQVVPLALTDSLGQTTYEVVVPSGAVNGIYDFVFIARAAGFVDSEPVTRQLEVRRSDPGLAVTPTPVDFGPVIVRDTTSQRVTLLNTNAGRLNVLSVRITGGGAADFALQILALPIVLQPGDSTSFALDFIPSAEGIRSADLELDTDAGLVTVSILGEGVVMGLAVTPDPITYAPPVDIGATAMRTVVLRNVRNAPLDVLSLRLLGDDAADFALPALALPLSIPPGDSSSFDLDFTPSAFGARRAVLEIDSDGGSLRILIIGEGAQPGISTAPEAVDFGPVEVGSMVDRTVAVINVGSGTLTLNGSQLIGPDASVFEVIVGGAAQTVPPGDTVNVVVRFAPSQTGPRTAILELLSDARDAGGNPVGSTLVALSGEGTMAVLVALETAPAAVDFGGVAVGTSSGVQALTVDNTGTVDLDLQIEVLGADADAFTLLGGGGMLTPSDPPQNIEVQFTPSRAGLHEATLRILWNVFETLIPLQGTGLTFTLSAPEPTGTAQDGEVWGVRVAVPDGFTPTLRQLFFRRSGERTYQQVDLQDAAGSLEGAVSAEFMTERGLDYYVQLSDDAGTSVTYPAENPAENPIHVQVAVARLTAGGVFEPDVYRMVSVPLELDDPTIQNLLDDYGPFDPTQWRALRWVPTEGAYGEAGVGGEGQIGLIPRRAFWLITRTGRGFEVGPGRSIDASAPFEVILPPGWSQVGSPFAFEVAVSSIVSDGPIQGPYFYDGTEYVLNPPTLVPWEGYFIFNPGPSLVTLSIPPVEAVRVGKQGASKALFAEADFVLQLQAELVGGAWQDTQNFIGFAEATAEQQLLFNLPAPPPIGDHLRLDIREADRSYASVFKPRGAGGQSWDLEIEAVTEDERGFTGGVVQVRLVEQGTRPEGFDLYVLDRDQGRVLPVEDGLFTVTLVPEQSVRHLSVIVGTTEVADAHSDGTSLVPVDYVLEQNYPNPFNPATAIRYGLHRRSHVMLEIYNVLGKRVRTLVAAEQSSGRYEIVWDGLDEAGRSVASGVYVYQLRTDGFITSRTMLLVR